MEIVKLVFKPPTSTAAGTRCALSNYSDNTCNTQITRTVTGPGQYTVSFLTKADIDETEVAYPIINVTCQSPTGTATVVNVLNPTTTYQPRNTEGYNYLVSFQIETMNIVPILLILGTLVTFVDRSVVMVSCELHCLSKQNGCGCA
jgi:hypothetical protein